MIHDLRRLFKAASAYYKMMEFGEIKNKAVQEELAAALIDVSISYRDEMESGNDSLERLQRMVTRTREVMMAKSCGTGMATFKVLTDTKFILDGDSL